MRIGLPVAISMIVWSSAAVPVTRAAQFHRLRPGVSGSAEAVSADGALAAGRIGYFQAFHWARASGFSELENPPGATSSIATGVANDGTVVGYTAMQPFMPLRWTGATGVQVLGDLPGGSADGWAHDITPNASVIVGSSYTTQGLEAFRWTAQAGMAGIGDLPGGPFRSEALAVSDDGSAIAGVSESSSGYEAFRWTENGGMQALGDLPGGEHRSIARGISADGATVVGWSFREGDVTEAFRWTEAEGMVGLGHLPGGTRGSLAYGTSADGTVIVGSSHSDAGNQPFIWDAEHGLRPLDLLLRERGADLEGWRLTAALDVSADGETLVGYGTIAGHGEAWLATIPEPAALALLWPAGAILLRRPRPSYRTPSYTFR